MIGRLWRRRGARWGAIGVVVLLVGVAAVALAGRSDDGDASHESFCFLFRDPDRAVRIVRQAIDGTTPADSTLDLAGLRSASGMLYGPRSERDAPSELRDEAGTVRRALARSVDEGSLAPLETPEAVTALQTLRSEAPAACPAP